MFSSLSVVSLMSVGNSDDFLLTTDLISLGVFSNDSFSSMFSNDGKSPFSIAADSLEGKKKV